ncbi:MAG: heme-binding protein [Geothrix sp.]|uniref:SOUL family heme-binding protein n=1 Tax=Geothrix sp. TaxID=1962974 RepID=UPI003BB09133
MAVMEPPFTLETATDEYDIRKYGPLLVAESRVEAGFDEAGTRGFKLLARYISGDNQSRTKVAGPSFESQHAPSETIAMTAPVCQEQSPWGFMIQFAMPASFTLATLPKPDDARVQLREIPPRRMAVHRYSGGWSEGLYQKHRKAFVAALKKDGVPTTGGPVFARFDSPFVPWFLRRNEIWMEVATP